MARSERAREKETIRYYQTWLESSRGYLSPKNVSRDNPLSNSDPSAPSRHEATQRISCDKGLVAFAQLGCLRLNVRRGIVTLLSSSTSYILAEATRTISLLSGGQHAEGDELWFGTASIPRSQGISELALDPPLHAVKSLEGQEYTAPALVLEDMTQDPRFSKREYVGNGTTFYAGVPIVSKSGFTIGVYSLTDDKPRPGGLTSQELQFMQDIASTVMDHLENIRNDTARHRGERMVLGLGAFTEGQTNLDKDTDNASFAHATTSEASDTSLTRYTFKGLTITETDPNALRDTMMREESSGLDEQHQTEGESVNPVQAQTLTSGLAATAKAASTSRKSSAIATGEEAEHSSYSLEYRRTYARAANILRQSMDSDGVLFFDALSANVGDDYKRNFGAHRADVHDSSTSSDEAFSSSGGSSDDFEEYMAAHVHDPELQHKAHAGSFRKQSKAKNCEMLGFSFRLSSVIKTRELMLKESEMRRFLRRYPKGLVMHFTEDGDISSTEEEVSAGDQTLLTKALAPNEKKRVIAQELIKIVPGARNVVWFPLWNFAKARWTAGCFIWSSHSGRLLNAQEDLVYLKAFASTIIGEINRLEAVASDQAKTSFVANISHELRSPLHGILGSIEFLQETAVDPFQASMITTVETCGKTLLDTVNHVLDFAKMSKRSMKETKRLGGQVAATTRHSDLEADVDLSIVIEEVLESIYAGQTFRSTGAFHANEDEELAMPPSFEEHAPMQKMAKRTQSKFSGAVRVLLDIERLDNWYVRTQPGALRRIVMNLFGNALKYTERGLVCVSLSRDKYGSQKKSLLSFCIRVTDTGKGMSNDFVENHAWEAFSQEDSFAHGVGLGLSIVRHITRSLGGKIDLQSEKDKGTVASVSLTAPRLTSPDESLDTIKAISRRVNGLKLCILNPELGNLSGTEAELSTRAEDSFRRMASSWFGMIVSRSKSIVGVTADFFIYIEPPPTEYLLEVHSLDTKNINVPVLVITPNAFESATLRRETQRITGHGRILEIISQPCGPAKFGMAVERCLDRGPFTAPPDIDCSVQAEGSRDGVATMETGSSTGFKPSSYSSSVLQPEIRFNALAPPKPRSVLSSPSSGLSSEAQSESIDSNISKSRGPVLLVDDNEVNLKLLVAFVRKAKYSYETATNGLEALNTYKEASKDPARAFSAIVIDVQMPVMDGVAATREIRAFESRYSIVRPANILALTGLASTSTQIECLKAGVDHFLSKPVKFKEFLKLLER